MRIARTKNETGSDFAVSHREGGWFELSALGIAADDLSSVIAQWDAVRAALERGAGSPLPAEPVLLCPVVRPSKVVAIGLNYLDHIRETRSDVPDRPVVFAKFPNTLIGPTDPIVVDPRLTDMADYEVELAVVMGHGRRWVRETDALSTVFGYCVANDVSARDWQQRDTQFDRSKGFDTFCPCGPWVTTADEVPDPQNLEIRSWVNDEARQASNTKEMLFSVAELVAFLSRGMTFEPGDVILTGTPHGVGIGMDPPVSLEVGDTVTCEVETLGRIENWVVGPDGR